MGNKTGTGVVKYSGYRDGSFPRSKGMKNKRKKKLRLMKQNQEAAMRRRDHEIEERDQQFAAEWNSWREENPNKGY